MKKLLLYILLVGAVVWFAGFLAFNYRINSYRPDEKTRTDAIIALIETGEWIRKNKVRSIRLVTSNYHIPRSLEEFRSQNPQIKIVPHPVYSENVSPQWWKNRGSFCLIASEYNKFLYVYLRTRLKGN